MKFPALTLLLLVSNATAQIVPTPPITASGIGKVTSKHETGDSLTISYSIGSQITSMTQSGSSIEPFRKVFRQLQVGCEYNFPQAFSSAPDTSKVYERAILLDLEKQPSFRATVEAKQSTDTRVSLHLNCADGQQLDFRYEGIQDHEKATRLIAALTIGETYEFPDCLLPHTVASQPAKAIKPPPAAEIEALRQYLGEWRGSINGDISPFITMSCALTADGRGIWREIVFDDSSPEPPLIDIAIVTYDPVKKTYSAKDVRQSSKPAITSTFDATTHTFTSKLPSPDPKLTRLNTATFDDPNTIQWKTVTLDRKGTKVATISGSYQRFIAQPPPPPATTLNLASLLPENSIFNLRTFPPFRAKVLSCEITEAAINITLACNTHHRIEIQHPYGSDWTKATDTARRLTVDSIYEFPDVLADDYSPPAADYEPRGSTEEMRALSAFIGDWEMQIQRSAEATPKGKIIVRYTWKTDGTGIWRETHTPEYEVTSNGVKQTQPAQVQAALINYDPTTRHYRETFLSPANKAVHTDIEWDAKTLTLSWSSKLDPVFGPKSSGTRRFLSLERIEWKSKAEQADGTLIQENSGYYQRVKE